MNSWYRPMNIRDPHGWYRPMNIRDPLWLTLPRWYRLWAVDWHAGRLMEYVRR